MKTPELTGETASINAGDATIIDLASSALALSGVTLRTFAEAAADAETDFANGDSVPVFVRVDATNWKRGTAVYDSATPKLTATWTTTKGTVSAGASVDVFVSRGEELHLDASEIVTGTLADARVAESNVTQHEAALTLSTAQVTAAGALMDSEVDADIKTLSLPASTTISAFGATVVDDADAAAVRTTLGLVIDTDVDLTDATNVDAAGAVMESDVDAKGDIFVATADNTLTRLPVGTNDQVLTADSAEASGLKYADASGGGAFEADADTQITPTTPIVLDHASNNEAALNLAYTTNKAAGDDTGLLVNMTDTASPGTSRLLDLQIGGTSIASIDQAGGLHGALGGLNIYEGASPAAVFKSSGSTFRTQIALSTSGLFPSIVLVRDADNVLAQRNSTNAQTYYISNTWTDSSNYEYGGFKWNSNVLEVASWAAGTGTLRGIQFGVSGNSIGFVGATPVAQQSGTGETTGFTAGSGTAVNDDSTFTGNVGSTAYRINDIVKALKNYGLLAS